MYSVAVDYTPLHGRPSPANIIYTCSTHEVGSTIKRLPVTGEEGIQPRSAVIQSTIQTLTPQLESYQYQLEGILGFLYNEYYSCMGFLQL